MGTDLIWTEKYRPSSLEDLAVPQRVRDAIVGGADQNLLFYGTPGCGKTTAARIIAAGRPSLFVNCSLHTGVDDVRTMVTDFCATASLVDAGHKVVVLDELDGVSDQYFKALRGVIEQFHATARFVATTNYFNKIPAPVRSRFECVPFDPEPGEREALEMDCMRRAYAVIKAEGMEADKEGLQSLVSRSFPDMRRVVSTLQGLRRDGVNRVTAEAVGRYRGRHRELFELALSDAKPHEVYAEVVGRYAAQVEEAVHAMGREFVEFLRDERGDALQHLGRIMQATAEHAYRVRFAVDPVVTLLSLVYTVQQITKKG